ncbi:ankyrin repeat domain-containing protein [Rickettsiales bacterium]|nr:ankyrin repeat domain-containing protein [Rickettsiales bacterium]
MLFIWRFSIMAVFFGIGLNKAYAYKYGQYIYKRPSFAARSSKKLEGPIIGTPDTGKKPIYGWNTGTVGNSEGENEAGESGSVQFAFNRKNDESRERKAAKDALKARAKFISDDAVAPEKTQEPDDVEDGHIDSITAQEANDDVYVNDVNNVYNVNNGSRNNEFNQSNGRVEGHDQESYRRSLLYPHDEDIDAIIQKYNKEIEEQARKEKQEEIEALDENTFRSLFDNADDLKRIEYKEDKRIIYNVDRKQERAIKEGLPRFPDMVRRSWDFQVLPPNIGQKKYVSSNTHLPSVLFQYEINDCAFYLIEHKKPLSDLRSVLSKVNNMNATDKYGNTMLMHSISGLNLDATLLLLEGGVDINKGNKFGVSPLHLAVYKQDYRTVAVLLNYEIEIDLEDDTGMTPLMYAVMSGNILLVKMLVENGAMVDIVKDGMPTVFQIAQEYGDKDVLQYLGEHSFRSSVFYS